MNVACLIRGPIRPNCESVIKNIQIFLESFKNYNINLDLYLCTWKDYSNDFAEIKRQFSNIKIVSASLTQEPFFYSKNYNFNPINCYKQYVLAKYSINTVSSIKEYDFIIHSRTDMQIKIEPTQWFNDGYYTTIHTVQDPYNNSPFTNDQFSVAQPSIMKKVWFYQQEAELLNLINNVPFPERILDFNIERDHILTKTAKPLIWKLDASRHKV